MKKQRNKKKARAKLWINVSDFLGRQRMLSDRENEILNKAYSKSFSDTPTRL